MPTTGATLVQGTSGLPIFVGAMAFAVKAVIDKVARDGGLEAGDTYLLQRPLRRRHPSQRFPAGASADARRHGVRLDRLGRPLARHRRRGARQLQSEGDRKLPGGRPLSAGQAVPRRRAAAGHRRHPRRQFARAAIELGRPQRPDQRARSRRAPACTALLDEYGDDTIAAALAALAARAEELMRANIAALPDGTYSCDDFLDNDGVTDAPLRIALDLTIAGDRMTLDFSRSAAALRRAAQHRALDRDRELLRRAEAHLHRRAGQRRLPRADRVRHSRHDAARASRRRGRSAATPKPSCASST